MSTPGASIPIGVYRGRGCGISAIGVYENFIGRQVQKVADFMAEQPTSWAQFENGNLTSAADVSVWQGVLGQRQLALGVPTCCGASAGSGGKTWADEANGVNDAHWEALGNRLIALGLGGALLRIGREFNGNWYPWQVAEGGQASYIAGYRHVVTVLHGLPGAAFRFCWSPALGVGNLTAKGTESCYPGDSYVDEIGVDVYDFTQRTSAGAKIYPGNAAGTTTAQQQQVLDIMLTQWDSFARLVFPRAQPWQAAVVPRVGPGAVEDRRQLSWRRRQRGVRPRHGRFHLRVLAVRLARDVGGPVGRRCLRPRHQAWPPDPGADEPGRVPGGVRLMRQQPR